MSIQFTREVEEGGKLPFLDIEVAREGNELKTTVYRKPTATKKYLHFSSHHANSIKSGVIKCLAKRAEAVWYAVKAMQRGRREEGGNIISRRNIHGKRLREDSYPSLNQGVGKLSLSPTWDLCSINTY